MKILKPGHSYRLASADESGPSQDIDFVRGPAEARESMGTTNEEVLCMLIDRMKFLNSEVPCEESEIVIHNLESALLALHVRTMNRKSRGVEGTNQA